MRFGEYKATLEHRIDLMGWVLYLYVDSPAGRTFLNSKGERVEVKEAMAVKDREKLWFARFDEDAMHAVAEAFAQKGIKTSTDAKNEGLLEATREHLGDMRQLVFGPHQEINQQIMMPPKEIME